MSMKWGQSLFLLIGLATLSSVHLQAQTATEVRSHAQTDVSVSIFGAFTGSYNNSVMSPEGEIGTTQSYSNAAGGLLEVRHITRPWLGYEGTYSINRANQVFSSSTYAVCGVCNATTTWIPVSANAHEVTGDWIASLKAGNLRPFALAGGGIFFVKPSSGQATSTTVINSCGGGVPSCVVGTVTPGTAITTSATKPVFVYGAGVDWELLPHLGLRLQYRGNLYKAPNLVSGSNSTNALTHTAEPMIGVYFRF